MKEKIILTLVLLLLVGVNSGCGSSSESESQPAKIGILLVAGGDNDHGFAEYTLKGAQQAATKHRLDLSYVTSDNADEYQQIIEKFINDGVDLIFTVGFSFANVTAEAAKQNPNRHFVIMDYAYYPGYDCKETAKDCYTQENGLQNVTSLVFPENEGAYLAGALAACMSTTDIIGSVAGPSIPPVVRFIEGFEKGAKSVSPDIRVLNQYIPVFSDRSAGYSTAMSFLEYDADVLFCLGGTTGLGCLQAAKEKNSMAIGVDVDQYQTAPEYGSVLITSVMKNVDAVAKIVVDDFARGQLSGGIRKFNLADEAIGLAPYHEWADKIPADCLGKVDVAKNTILNSPHVSLPKYSYRQHH